MTASLKLTRLLNADGETVGYFSDHVAEMAARMEWNEHYDQRVPRGQSKLSLGLVCRSVDTPIAPAALEDVEPGDGDRDDYFDAETAQHDHRSELYMRLYSWYQRGAASVEVSRYLVNRWRRPGKPSRDADLGGASEAAGVLYVLRVKAPK